MEDLTGSHTRVVWLQDAWDLNDVFSDRGRLRLMGFDSRDGRGEREILPGPASFRKPFLTPCGGKVVFSDHDTESVRIVDWEGRGQREVAVGTALAVWSEPDTGRVWIYVGRDKVNPPGHAFNRVLRLPLDDPAFEEPVWDETQVGRDNFQLSADGLRAAAMLPWPHCGMANLREGGWELQGRGCWTGMAPDNRYLMWMLDGAHRNLTLFDTRGGRRWQVPLAQAPGVGSHEVYHPRWSNHPRFMVMTGPYKIRHGGNNIRGGGDAVELHVGRFSADFSEIESWVRVTENPYANFFPDLWIATGRAASAAISAQAASNAPGVDGPEGTERVDPPDILLTARLKELSPIPQPEDILPYRRALVANTYVVESIEAGELPHERILVAHWVIRDGKVLAEAKRESGRQYAMRIQDFLARKDLEGERLAKDVDDLLLPLFYDTGSAP